MDKDTVGAVFSTKYIVTGEMIMKKTLRVDGLDCGNCAAKIERQVASLGGVENASVNFILGKMTIEADDEEMEGIVEQARKIVAKVEPGAKLR